jgi:uncharacterized protein YutE (UPF0331/DUF86 family)
VTIIERLAELKQHLEHLRELQGSVSSVRDLEDDMSLHNDVLFSLLMVAQLVVDISGELSSQAGLPFEDYTTAVRRLSKLEGFTPELVEELSRLPGFRNVLLHDYVELDYDLVLKAMARLDPVEEFVRVVSTRMAADDDE